MFIHVWVVFSLLTLPLLYGEEALLNLSMNARDREAIGVDRLNPQQKKALERWLETWTRTVITHAPSYHPSITLPQWVAMWREEQRRERTIEDEDPEAAVHTIFRNKNGEVLELANGSIWNIVPFDQFAVSMWKRGDKVTITHTTLDTMRPYTIINTFRNEQAGAKLQRQASPDGKRPKDSPSYFEGSLIIESIGINGSSIVLENGKTWNIAPLDQARVLNNWKILDRIRITKNRNLLYPDKLNNLDSGDSAGSIEQK